MKLYVYVNYFRTGGPEALHQLCDMARTLGYDSFMFYADTPESNPCLYTEKYLHIQRALDIEDHVSNVLIIPEQYSISTIMKSYGLSKIRVALWWLSWDYGCNLAAHNISYDETGSLIHLFQSAYARDMVCKLSPNILGFDVGEYIHDDLLLREWNRSDKQPIVAYNPKKDKMISGICAKYNIQCIPIHDMTFDQVVRSLQSCMVYVDCGYHPGMDRIPREAAALGCVVITNRSGSAKYYNDIPILQKCDTEEELIIHIIHSMNYYDEAIKSQDTYRDMIYKQKQLFAKQVRSLCQYLTHST